MHFDNHLFNVHQQKFQRNWEEIVNILYDTANDLLYRPYPYLVVVEEEENEKPCLSGSSEKDNPVRIHIEVL